MLRCDEPHVVQGGSENVSEALSRTAWCYYHPPAVEYQCSTSKYVITCSLLSKNNLKKSGHDIVVDRILCVRFCGPKKNVSFSVLKAVA